MAVKAEARYRIVEFHKPPKHLRGARNHPIKIMGTYKLLIKAEQALLTIGSQMVSGGQIGFRIDDLEYRTQQEFWNPTNGRIYVKMPYRNDVGKRAFESFSLGEYRNYILQKADNPFSAVI